MIEIALAKYPISHNAGKTLGEFFESILTFHVPPSEDKTILDPTCGRKYLWERFLRSDSDGRTGLESYGRVVFSDSVDYGQEIVSDIRDLKPDTLFDGIIYDPPYFYGYSGSKDPRRRDYGDYIQTYEQFLWFADFANERFPSWLKDGGKLIVKCADQYHTRERRFHPHHVTWVNRLSSFELVDLYVFIHHRMSPTAFQVRDRPCAVIMHTYFLVFKTRAKLESH